jgi:hypothetical protein
MMGRSLISASQKAPQAKEDLGANSSDIGEFAGPIGNVIWE